MIASGNSNRHADPGRRYTWEVPARYPTASL